MPNFKSDAQPSAVEGGPVVETNAAVTDPGEDAYTQGFRLWEAGQYDQAIQALKAFTAAFETL